VGGETSVLAGPCLQHRGPPISNEHTRHAIGREAGSRKSIRPARVNTQGLRAPDQHHCLSSCGCLYQTKPSLTARLRYAVLGICHWRATGDLATSDEYGLGLLTQDSIWFTTPRMRGRVRRSTPRTCFRSSVAPSTRPHSRHGQAQLPRPVRSMSMAILIS